jgi:hypothetical protein
MWKNMFFSSGNCKKGLQFCIGKWKRPSEQVAWGEENLAITQKWSNGDPDGRTSFSLEYYNP